MTNSRNRLANYLEPINQDKCIVVDFSTCRAVMASRVTMVAYIVVVVLVSGVTATAVWASTLQVSTPAVQDTAVVGSIPGATETPTEIRGGPGQETNSQAQVGPLIVSVVGLAVSSGVMEAPAGAQVAEAIDRAGGLLSEANPASVNLAASLVDGQQIVVGIEAPPAGVVGGGADVSGGPSVGAVGIAGPGDSDGKININAASATQLEELPEIGLATATRTIDFREKDGVLTSIDVPEEVPGIDPAKVEILCDTVTV